jgi:hypothetical protein
LNQRNRMWKEYARGPQGIRGCRAGQRVRETPRSKPMANNKHGRTSSTTGLAEGNHSTLAGRNTRATRSRVGPTQTRVGATQFHVEHQERRTCDLVWWGRLGDNSRFEPTKSLRTNNTLRVRKKSADTKGDDGAGGMRPPQYGGVNLQPYSQLLFCPIPPRYFLSF